MNFDIKKNDFDAAVTNARESLLRNDLKIVAEIPTSKIVNGAGFHVRPITQFFFFSPDFMHAILVGSEEAIMHAPIKLVIRQKQDGQLEGVVQLPSEAFADFAEFKSYIKALDLKVQDVVNGLV